MSEQADRPHADGKHCWCKPTLYYKTRSGRPIWTHYDSDDKVRREPPPQMMFDMIAELAWSEHDQTEA